MYCVNPIAYRQQLAREPIPALTPQEVRQRYQIGNGIGGGGMGVVYSVTENRTHRTRALKFTTYSESREIDQKHVCIAINQILDLQLSPHLTRVETPFKTPRGTFMKVFENFYPQYPCFGYLMDLLEGDMQNYFFRNRNRDEHLAFLIQYASIEVLLANKYAVQIIDGDDDFAVLRNTLYKILAPEDTFRGKRLIEYDYWKYTICGYDFYLPRPKILIKLADYDLWQCNLARAKYPDLGEDKSSDLGIDTIKYRFFEGRSAPTSLDELLEKFKKPNNPAAKILDMGS